MPTHHSLQDEINSLKFLLAEKTDPLLHSESLFQRELNALNFQITSLEEKRKKSAIFENRITEFQLTDPIGTRSAFPTHRHPEEFSFSQNEGEGTSHFSYEEIEESMQALLPYPQRNRGLFDGLGERPEKKVIFLPVIDGPRAQRSPGLFPFKLGESIVKRYRVDSVLSNSESSVVVKCMDSYQKEWVCLKIFYNKQEAFEKGMNEVRILKEIEGSTLNLSLKCISRMIKFFYYKSHLIIVYELFEHDLESLLVDNSHVIRENLTQVLNALLIALDHIHSMHIVHGNIHSRNILISLNNSTEFNALRLINFEYSHSSVELPGNTNSPAYSPPELLSHTVKSDIWSLGCLVAEIATETPPNAPLSDLIQNLLKADPSERISAGSALTHPYFCSFYL